MLDDDARAALDESTDAVGRKRNPPLARGGLLGNSNLHSGFGSGGGAKGNDGVGKREAGDWQPPGTDDAAVGNNAVTALRR